MFWHISLFYIFRFKKIAFIKKDDYLQKKQIFNP